MTLTSGNHEERLTVLDRRRIGGGDCNQPARSQAMHGRSDAECFDVPQFAIVLEDVACCRRWTSEMENADDICAYRVDARRHRFLRAGTIDRARAMVVASDDFDFLIASLDAHPRDICFLQKNRKRANALRDMIRLLGHCLAAFAQERIEPGLLLVV
jgi:hypothetical protein